MISSKNQNKICAVIPFFNEEKHLSSVIENVLNYVDLVIMVNDGSTDNSRALIPDNNKIILIDHPENYGKGRALHSGIFKSTALGTEITITIDADNQHDPSYIPHFIKALAKHDVVIGSRKKEKSAMPIHRRLSNYLTSKLLSIKTGENIIDSQSGFRAFRTSICSNILPKFSGFEAESEMIVKACRNNLRLGFLEIPTIYGEDDSKMKAIPTIIGFIKVLLKS